MVMVSSADAGAAGNAKAAAAKRASGNSRFIDSPPKYIPQGDSGRLSARPPRNGGFLSYNVRLAKKAGQDSGSKTVRDKVREAPFPGCAGASWPDIALALTALMQPACDELASLALAKRVGAVSRSADA